MRIWIIAAVSIIAGVSLGLGATMFDLGVSPSGSDELHVGTPAPKQTVPAAGPGAPLPQVAVEQDEFRFGAMERGEHQQHAFILKNAGRGDLILHAGAVSCGRCTSFDIQRDHLRPGESTRVTVRWSAEQPAGPFRQNVQVETNDPQRPIVVFYVSGLITSSYRATPDTISLGPIRSGDTAQAEVRIFDYKTDHLEIVGHELLVKGTAPFFSVAIEKMSADEVKREEGARSGCVAHIQIKPGLPVGPFQQRIQLRLNLPDAPPVEVPIDGKVTGVIEVTGRMWDAETGIVMWGQVRSSEGAKTELVLVVHGPNQAQVNLKLRDVDPDTLHVTIGPKLGTPGGQVTRIPLTIEVPKGSRPTVRLGNAQGKLGQINLDTGLTESPQLRVYVRFAVEN